MSILDVRGITIAYNGRDVIRDFSMQLKRGEFVGITGVSGCGKSSLLRALLGFVPITSGEVCFCDRQVLPGQFEKFRRHTAFLPQDLTFPCEWVYEAVRHTLDFKVNREHVINDDTCISCFERLGLPHDVLKKRLNEISGGQRQRIMLATVSMLDKDLLFLDEPTSALDAKSVNIVIDYLKELCSNGKTILAVTHDKTFSTACERIINIPIL